MRIGCLQFAPHVGDVDNNLNRADSVLSRAEQDDLDSLDLLVVPEMAFSGEYLPSRPSPAPGLLDSGAAWAHSGQGTTSSHCSTSCPFSSTREAASARSGPAR